MTSADRVDQGRMAAFLKDAAAGAAALGDGEEASSAWAQTCVWQARRSALEATQGQNDSFFSQLPYKGYLEDVASVGD